jgi:hypothetical protein
MACGRVRNGADKKRGSSVAVREGVFQRTFTPSLTVGLLRVAKRQVGIVMEC